MIKKFLKTSFEDIDYYIGKAFKNYHYRLGEYYYEIINGNAKRHKYGNCQLNIEVILSPKIFEILCKNENVEPIIQYIRKPDFKIVSKKYNLFELGKLNKELDCYISSSGKLNNKIDIKLNYVYANYSRGILRIKNNIIYNENFRYLSKNERLLKEIIE